MVASLSRKIVNAYANWRAWKTNRKILVIESDDWGSRRTDNHRSREALNMISAQVKRDRFTQLDNLASTEDLTALFDVLTSTRDQYGRPAILTANVCTANPDFTRIKAANFEAYFYEPFYETIGRNADGNRILALWQEGAAASQRVFHPQLHGREHLHALAWLAELRVGNTELRRAFDWHSWGIPYHATGSQRRKNLQAALDIYGLPGETEFQQKWLQDSAAIFQSYFGFSAATFIAPAYTWHPRIQNNFLPLAIRGIQGIKLQRQPALNGKGRARRKFRYTGKRSKENTVFLVRNAFFEPCSNPNVDWISRVLRSVKIAYDHCQPAILSSHRINFIGSLEETNRSRNLKMLRILLGKLKQQWPDIEFMSSDQLLKLIDQ